MTELDLAKLLGQSGIAVVALVILGRVVLRVGERMIAAIDRVGTKIDAHTKEDVGAIGGLRQDIAVMRERVETAIDLAQPRYKRAQTEPRNVISAASVFRSRKDGE